MDISQLYLIKGLLNGEDINKDQLNTYLDELEKELGITIFIRDNYTLTDQGQLFVDECLGMYDTYQSFMKKVHKSHDSLQLGLLANGYFSFPILSDFEKKYQYIDITYKDNDSIIDELENKEIDAIISPDVLLKDEKYQRIKMFDIEEGIVCSHGLLAQYGSIPEVIRHTPIITTKGSNTAYIQEVRDILKKRYNYAFTGEIRVHSVEKQLQYVNEQKGFAIMPIELVKNELWCRKIDDLLECAQIIYNKDHISPSLQLLLDEIRRNTNE